MPTAPFWSPDSRFLGFFAGGKLKKIEVSGGPADYFVRRAGRSLVARGVEMG